MFERLTRREREVIGLVTSGLMNKQIAGELNVSEITVKIHRGHVMKKMGARSLAELVKMAEALGINRGGLIGSEGLKRKPKYDFHAGPHGTFLLTASRRGADDGRPVKNQE